MSLAVDQMAPAASIGSAGSSLITRIVSRILKCGAETLASWLARIWSSVVYERVIPSGWKIRVRTNSSHDIPDARATTSPAALYITFW